MRRPSHQRASEGRSTGYGSWTADRHPLKNAVSEQGPYGRAGTSVSCRARDQATALRQASPVRRLMISKPLPFVVPLECQLVAGTFCEIGAVLSVLPLLRLPPTENGNQKGWGTEGAVCLGNAII